MLTEPRAEPSPGRAGAPRGEPEVGGASGGGDQVVVALAQIAPRLGDVRANVDGHLEVIAAAAAAGAGLVVFPELSLSGYFLKDLVTDTALRLDSEELNALAGACQNIDGVVGCILESDDHRLHNAAVYLSGGGVAHVHRKVYLPTYGLFDEARYLAGGDRFRAFPASFGSPPGTPPWRAGILICEDMWHPSSAWLLARDGVDVLICPSASPGRGVGRGSELGTARSYDVMTRTYAQLFTTYLVYCNRVGYEDGVNFWGGSRVVDPQGEIDGEQAGREPAMRVHHLQRAALRRARIANPMLRDERHDVVDAESRRLRRRERE